MLKKIAATALIGALGVITFGGCTETGKFSNNAKNGYSKECIDGVTYIKFKMGQTGSHKGYYGITVKMKPNGKPETCDADTIVLSNFDYVTNELEPK
jgi:hypothetical protein